MSLTHLNPQKGAYQWPKFTRMPITSVSIETGLSFINQKWKSIRFFFDKRAFESMLERILRAAAGHEGNSLPSGDHHYRLLNAQVDEVVAGFADRWGLDVSRFGTEMVIRKVRGMS